MRGFIFSILLVSSTVSIAASRPCPSTFKFYDLGQTSAEIAAACGQPVKIEKARENVSTQQNVTLLMYQFQAVQKDTSQPTTVATPTVTFQMKSGKVSGIKVANNDTTSTLACGEPIKINDSYNTVIGACGDPLYVDQETEASPPTSDVVEVWTYKKNEYLKPVQMKFINGKLESVNE